MHSFIFINNIIKMYHLYIARQLVFLNTHFAIYFI